LANLICYLKNDDPVESDGNCIESTITNLSYNTCRQEGLMT